MGTVTPKKVLRLQERTRVGQRRRQGTERTCIGAPSRECGDVNRGLYHAQKPIPIRGDEHLDPDQESRHESNGEAPDCRGTCKHPGRPKSMNPTRSRVPPISTLAQPRTTAEDRLFIDPGTRQRGPQAEIVTRQLAASTGNRMASRLGRFRVKSANTRNGVSSILPPVRPMPPRRGW